MEKGTTIVVYMKTLAELDIIAREVPVTEVNPEKSRMGQYRITDHYLHFWFRFVYPYRSLIERGQTEWVLEKMWEVFVFYRQQTIMLYSQDKE